MNIIQISQEEFLGISLGLGMSLGLIIICVFYYNITKRNTCLDEMTYFNKKHPEGFKLWFMINKNTDIPSEIVNMLEEVMNPIEGYNEYIIRVSPKNLNIILSYSKFFDRIEQGHIKFKSYK
jgi:hypothetical protein